ncbi:alanine--tRNA ligase, partial [Candidatus Saccharibacteria bacterium]|nr:alanine--tRNA ligase [Candidatus Saccharibacteria bacterium]
EERLRFDFSHPEKVTPEQLKAVEDMVNEQIDNDLIITFEEHPKEKALKELKPLGHFGDRYGDVIKIYRMQGKDAKEPFSYEICGGPHVEHTGQLADGGKKFKIVKEEASSAGIRRIKAQLQ